MDVDIICSTEPFIWLIDWFGLVCFREKENAPHLGAALGRKEGTDPPLSLPVCAGGKGVSTHWGRCDREVSPEESQVTVGEERMEGLSREKVLG